MVTRFSVWSSNVWLRRGLFFLAASAVYLYAFPSPTLFYEAIVLAHVLTGVLVAARLGWRLWPLLRAGTALDRAGWLLLAAGTVLGLILIRIGTPHRLKAWLYAHIALCVFGLLFLVAAWFGKRGLVTPA